MEKEDGKNMIRLNGELMTMKAHDEMMQIWLNDRRRGGSYPREETSILCALKMIHDNDAWWWGFAPKLKTHDLERTVVCVKIKKEKTLEYHVLYFEETDARFAPIKVLHEVVEIVELVEDED